MKTKLPTYREDEFTDQVLQLAGMMGWRRVHFRPGQTAKGWRTPVQGDGKGYPDLTLVRPPRLIYAELKVGNNKPTPEQESWLYDLRRCSVEVYLWYPEDMAAIVAVLSRPTEPVPLVIEREVA